MCALFHYVSMSALCCTFDLPCRKQEEGGVMLSSSGPCKAWLPHFVPMVFPGSSSFWARSARDWRSWCSTCSTDSRWSRSCESERVRGEGFWTLSLNARCILTTCCPNCRNGRICTSRELRWTVLCHTCIYIHTKLNWKPILVLLDHGSTYTESTMFTVHPWKFRRFRQTFTELQRDDVHCNSLEGSFMHCVWPCSLLGALRGYLDSLLYVCSFIKLQHAQQARRIQTIRSGRNWEWSPLVCELHESLGQHFCKKGMNLYIQVFVMISHALCAYAV